MHSFLFFKFRSCGIQGACIAWGESFCSLPRSFEASILQPCMPQNVAYETYSAISSTPDREKSLLYDEAGWSYIIMSGFRSGHQNWQPDQQFGFPDEGHRSAISRPWVPPPLVNGDWSQIGILNYDPKMKTPSSSASPNSPYFPRISSYGSSMARHSDIRRDLGYTLIIVLREWSSHMPQHPSLLALLKCLVLSHLHQMVHSKRI